MTTNLIEKVADKAQHIEMTLKLTGEAPLMMHAPTLLDPLHPLTREMGKLTSKQSSKRTIADVERMARVEWEAGLYHDESLGPFIAALNVKKAIRLAGGRWKLGPSIDRGVSFPEMKLALHYDGPRDRDELWDAGFKDVRPIRNGGLGGGRVMRCRPCFEEWALETPVLVDPHEIGLEDFAMAVERAQRFGIGDFRPEFGLFTAELWGDA